jgi:uncharacterized RDD family membrane protein YckC
MENKSLLNKSELLPSLLEPATAVSRILNICLDMFFIAIFMFTFAGIWGFVSELVAQLLDINNVNNIGLLKNIFQVLIYVLPFAYYIVLEVMMGKTIGKMITKTKVVSRTTGLRPPLKNIIGRTLARCIPIDFISYFTTNPIGWHDSLSGTMVISDTAFYHNQIQDEEER